MTDIKKTKSAGREADKLRSIFDGCANIGCKNKPKDGEKFKFCPNCLAVAYCSRECQLSRWRNHKSGCKEFQNGGASRRDHKDYRNAATFVVVFFEPRIFAYVKERIGHYQSKMKKHERDPLAIALKGFVEHFVVDFRCDHIITQVTDIEDYICEISTKPLDLGLTSVEEIDESTRNGIAASSGKNLYVRVIKEHSTYYIPIYEGMLSDIKRGLLKDNGDKKGVGN